MAEKEGESYLDQLLNNASTSSQEAGVEQVKENAGKALHFPIIGATIGKD